MNNLPAFYYMTKNPFGDTQEDVEREQRRREHEEEQQQDIELYEQTTDPTIELSNRIHCD
jgi:hypothetical protein